MEIETPALIGTAIVITLIAASAFFSSSETAIFSLANEATIDTERTDGAIALGQLRSDPHRLLVTLLVGNNIVNVAITSIITAIFASQFSPGLAVTGATIVASTVVLIFGEIVPKSYGLSNATTWSITVAKPLKLVERILFPLVMTFDAITRRLNDQLNVERDIAETYLKE